MMSSSVLRNEMQDTSDPFESRLGKNCPYLFKRGNYNVNIAGETTATLMTVTAKQLASVTATQRCHWNYLCC